MTFEEHQDRARKNQPISMATFSSAELELIVIALKHLGSDLAEWLDDNKGNLTPSEITVISDQIKKALALEKKSGITFRKQLLRNNLKNN